MPQPSLNELNRQFDQAARADVAHFAEQRSSLLMFAGKHHQGDRPTSGGLYSREFARVTAIGSPTKRAINQLRITLNQILG